MVLNNNKALFFGIFFLLTLGLSGCGGDSSDSDPAVTVQGSVFASAVAGATVSIQDTSGATVAGFTSTDNNGFYSLAIDSALLASDLIVVSQGGSYVDEATGEVLAAGGFSAYIPAGAIAAARFASVTPGSTIIQKLVAGGMPYAEALAIFQANFGYLPDLAVSPVNITIDQSAAGEQADAGSLLAGLQAAAFSQLVADLNGSSQLDSCACSETDSCEESEESSDDSSADIVPLNQSQLMDALVADLADGNADGMNGGEEIFIGDTGRSLGNEVYGQFAQSYVAIFQSACNKSGLDNDQIGTLPQPTSVATESYQVQFIAGEDGTSMGRDAFQLMVTDHDGMAVTGADVSVHPLMNMSGGHSHSTAVGHVMENGETQGLYDAVVYYLMASVMAGGDSMGWWKLSVCISSDDAMSMEDDMHGAMDMDEAMGMDDEMDDGHMHGHGHSAECHGEEAVFYPSVAMAMGVRGTLKGGDDDQIFDMMTETNIRRSYEIFKDTISAEDETSFHAHVYIAAREDMMTFTGLTEGVVLNEGSDNELSVIDVAVDFSVNGVDWVSASNGHGGGVWAADMTGIPDKLQVRLSVNGFDKTETGEDIDNENVLGYVELDIGSMSMSESMSM